MSDRAAPRPPVLSKRQPPPAGEDGAHIRRSTGGVGLGRRRRLAAAQEAADEQWSEFNDELAGTLDELRDELAEEEA